MEPTEEELRAEIARMRQAQTEVTETEIQQEIARMRQEQQPSAMGAFSRGMRQVATLGAYDNLAALGAGMHGLITEGEFWGPASAEYAEQRAILEEDRQQHPWATLGGELVGSTLPGTAISKAVGPVVGFGKRLVASGIPSGLENVAQEADRDVRPGLEAWMNLDRVKDFGIGFALGGGIDAAPELVRGRFGTNTLGERQADSVIARAMGESNLSGADINARLAGKPDVMRPADIDPRLRDEAETAMQSGGHYTQEAETFLAQRDLGAIDRILGTARRAFGIPMDNPRAWRNQRVQDLEQVSSDIYNRMSVRPVTEEGNQRLSTLFYNPEVQRALKNVGDEIDIATIGIEGATRNAPGTMGYWNEVYKQIGDSIGAKLDAGRPAEAARRMKVQKQLRDIMNEIDPEFRDARETWAAAQDLGQTFDLGKSIPLAPTGQASGDTYKEMMELYDTLQPNQQEIFKLGVFDGMDSFLRNTPKGSRKKINWYDTEMKDEFIRHIYGDDAAEIMRDAMQNEADMRLTLERNIGNSRTNMRRTRTEERRAAETLNDEEISAIVVAAAVPTPRNINAALGALNERKRILTNQAQNNQVAKALLLTENLMDRFNKYAINRPKTAEWSWAAAKGIQKAGALEGARNFDTEDDVPSSDLLLPVLEGN